MKNIFYLLPIVFAMLVACNNNPQPNQSEPAPEPAPEPVIVDSTHTTAIANKKPIIWTMEVEPNGIIMFGNKAISIINLQKTLIDSLKACYTQKVTLPDTMVYTTKGEVLMGIRGSVQDAITQSLAEAAKVR